MLFSDRSQRERQEVGDEAGNLLNSARKHRVWQTARTARDLLALVSRGGPGRAAAIYQDVVPTGDSRLMGGA
jgi:hypothetical protein